MENKEIWEEWRNSGLGDGNGDQGDGNGGQSDENDGQGDENVDGGYLLVSL